MDPQQVGQGVVEGGWSYVWAAYGISWFVFIFYAANVFIRARGQRS